MAIRSIATVSNSTISSNMSMSVINSRSRQHCEGVQWHRHYVQEVHDGSDRKYKHQTQLQHHAFHSSHGGHNHGGHIHNILCCQWHHSQQHVHDQVNASNNTYIMGMSSSIS